MDSIAATGQLMIGGEWRHAADGGTLDVVDPSTGEVFAVIGRGGAADVDEAVRAARTAFDAGWGLSLIHI